MEEVEIKLTHTKALGYTVPMGSFNLVFAKTEMGMIGCGAFDVQALEKFNYPAARITGVASLHDLLEGTVIESNPSAKKAGIQKGMTGRQSLQFL